MASNGKDATEVGLGTKKLYHKVRKGETLAAIAKKYDVDIDALKEWNRKHIKKNRVQKGQKLIVYKSAPLLAENKSKPKVKSDVVSSDSIKVETVKSVDVNPNEADIEYQTSAKAEENKQKVTHYTVKKGDNLWLIAQKFELTPKKIQKDNNLKSARDLQVGQKLKIVLN